QRPGDVLLRGQGRHLRHPRVHQPHEPVLHPLPGRRALDGHRRRYREHEARRRGGDRDSRYRGAEQSRGEGTLVTGRGRIPARRSSMTFDLVIKNGTLVDGTGAPARRADVAIAGGKIAEVGRVTDGASRVIDAADLVVAPGFIDPHTHYDAQICWDGAVTPSSWHGVTSVIMPNSGVGIPPWRPQTREIAMRDHVNGEAIPFDVLNMGISWDWETFPDFIAAAEKRHPSLNLAFVAPLTPFRHYVMGEASMERAATPEETAKIAGLIGEAIDAGALGFSSTTLNQHIGFEGKPLACRNASPQALKPYPNQLKRRGKGAIEIALTRQVGVLEQDQCDLLDFLLTESGRPVTFIALFDRDDIPEAVRDTLRRCAPQIAKGARPQTSPLPLTR